MKKLSPLLFLFGVAAFAFGLLAATMWVGTLTTVNNTTAYSTTNVIGSATFQAGTFSITNTGVTQTTALTLSYQITLDGTNFYTQATWQPPVTNAGTYSWSIGQLSPNISARIAITTTNGITLGIFQ